MTTDDKIIVHCVWEHNSNDSLIYSSNVIGAFSRGASKEEALKKMPIEIESYFLWTGEIPPSLIKMIITQESATNVSISDADSEVLFETERKDLSIEEYERLKVLVLKSANDFLSLYNSFHDKNQSVLPVRKTFYGTAPRTASEMYLHTKNVNAYYWGEIGLDISNDGTIVENRIRGFEELEARGNFLSGKVYEGSYGEEWSIPKVLRRFLWHDRIHAKAMYRMSIATFGTGVIPNIFKFKL
ncbi:MAG TPA: hypothetical protein PLZ06_05320 [Clostridia bacterium]|jgi:hypothetical protein|nr:hypothetical protein [Clostridia bacterium]HQC68323.1 hypothetical protein [Clostridia bacterium]